MYEIGKNECSHAWKLLYEDTYGVSNHYSETDNQKKRIVRTYVCEKCGEKRKEEEQFSDATVKQSEKPVSTLSQQLVIHAEQVEKAAADERQRFITKTAIILVITFLCVLSY